MKKLTNALLFSALIFNLGFITSCKSKTDKTENTTITDSSTISAPAVVVNGDADLNKGLADAVKDYPTVKADAMDGVINLSGTINQSDWQRLNPTLNSLHPKKINSTNLTIK